jgi:hypothetical protein
VTAIKEKGANAPFSVPPTQLMRFALQHIPWAGGNRPIGRISPIGPIRLIAASNQN